MRLYTTEFGVIHDEDTAAPKPKPRQQLTRLHIGGFSVIRVYKRGSPAGRAVHLRQL